MIQGLYTFQEEFQCPLNMNIEPSNVLRANILTKLFCRDHNLLRQYLHNTAKYFSVITINPIVPYPIVSILSYPILIRLKNTQCCQPHYCHKLTILVISFFMPINNKQNPFTVISKDGR